MSHSFIIAGGGTGGHVTPALALGEALRRLDQRVLFLGSKRGLETKLVPDAGFELVALDSSQVMGRGVFGRIGGALAILRAAFGARRAIKQHGAEAVISVGGYAAMPAMLAAVVSRVPIALIEPNAIPGRVNRLSARFARLVFPGFEIAATRLGAEDRSHLLGVPLRQALVEAFASGGARRTLAPPFRLLVFGGSQGARQINEAMMAAAPGLASLDIEVFHAAGKADCARVADAYEKAGVTAEVVVFESNLPARYQWADIAICRSGALTIAELALAGMPALLVPYPFAADNHQAANADELEKIGAARRLEGLDDATRGGERIVTTLRDIFAAPGELSAMGNAARSVAYPNAAQDIVMKCMELVEAGPSHAAAGGAAP
ncbi:MAG: undecaprenyldiphospho-muramoylpentapeptide beta-N-acetylglucosaminyltransferase [Myxococcota bacterium]|nr:undecaprenyldiphospho-muramoylpentapeptide beta-N-acetylglucosaminyltransferase [Myxococcota bacterium]